jgi:uncharacterized protein (TIGR03083 family)
MDRGAYLEHLKADGHQLADVAEGHLDAPVPTCPGWSVADLVTHVGGIYAHRADVVANRRTTAPDGPRPQPDPGEDLIAWTRRHLDALGTALATTPPETPVWTWSPDDQTVGFWCRRMAQESLVHRIDAELAVGTLGPIDALLAVDGIDELIHVFLVPEVPIAGLGGSGQVVALQSGANLWHVALQPDRVVVAPLEAEPDVMVQGVPEALLCWVWGRTDDGAVSVEGDVGALTILRHALVHATQ